MRRLLYAIAIALAAALVFVVQPMVARFLLPVVGGSTLVWSAALVFFQAALLVGYGVAHLLTRLPRNVQPWAFLVTLGVAGFATLPFAVSGDTASWSSPITWVIGQLALMVGPPFVLLSATSPLLQRWYSLTDEPDAAEPYRLYAASNAGSIIGLLAYPFLIEPLATLQVQALGWAIVFGALLVLIAAVALISRGSGGVSGAAAAAAPPDRAAQLWWVVCAAIPSSLLVTLTANITADIAPVPLLWVVPLAVYLGSHVWVFSRRAPDSTRAVRALVALGVPYTGLTLFASPKPWWFFAPLGVIVLGVVAVAYHGELVRTRPAPQHLTWFYLWTAVGGVLGGAFATFGGPALFDTLYERHLELMLAVAVLPWVRDLGRSRAVVFGGIVFVGVVTLVGGTEVGITASIATATAGVVAVLAFAADRRVGVAALFIGSLLGPFLVTDVATYRSPYARYRVATVTNELGEFHELIVGAVSHGTQARAEMLRRLPLAYYHPAGPVGQVMRDAVAQGPVAVIGLGVGAAAAYASDERPVTFLELDPLVARLARDPSNFTHLAQCGSNCTVQIGDGRLSVADLDDGSLALLIVDAFSGDAIPTHLLTKEAFELYQKKLRPGGAILVNGSNMYVDIPTVVANAGAATGLRAVSQDYWPREAHLRDLQVSASEWVLLCRDDEVIERLAADPRWKLAVGDAAKAWTDDWQNLFAYYTWR